MVFSAVQFFLMCGLVFLWLVCLTVITLRMIGRYNRLINGASGSNLSEALETILKKGHVQGKHLVELQTRLEQIEADGMRHAQRIGVVRFNPFMDTGGSQSFTVAVLDGQDSGLLMTSLYGRAGNRWYVKEVHLGKGVDIELSKEEQLAIKKARGISA